MIVYQKEKKGKSNKYQNFSLKEHFMTKFTLIAIFDLNQWPNQLPLQTVSN